MCLVRLIAEIRAGDLDDVGAGCRELESAVVNAAEKNQLCLSFFRQILGGQWGYNRGRSCLLWSGSSLCSTKVPFHPGKFGNRALDSSTLAERGLKKNSKPFSTARQLPGDMPISGIVTDTK
jgi:hypothetical protein